MIEVNISKESFMNNFLYYKLNGESMANPQDYSKAIIPFGIFNYSNSFFDYMKTWATSLNNNISPTDLRIWVPRAFYLNWADLQIAQINDGSNDLVSCTIGMI
jgi:hypothetical protein